MPLAEKGFDAGSYFRASPLQFDIPNDFTIENTISLSAGGDLMPYKSINSVTCGQLWEDAGNWFFDADIVTANLETPIDRNKPVSPVPEVMLNDMYFNGDAAMFDIFSGNGKYKGYDLLSVANNHSLDQGAEGLIQTMEFLDEKGIAWCGAARPDKGEYGPTIIERKDIKLAFIGATFSLNAVTIPIGNEEIVNLLPLNRESPNIQLLIKQAEEARTKAVDLIVLMLHIGPAYQAYPGQIIMENMHTIVAQTGADLVLGGHPHNAQPAEIFNYTLSHTSEKKQALIVYSQADFIAYDIYKWCHLPLLLKISIAKGSSAGKNKTLITGISFKLFYMYAEIRDHAIKSLRLLDYHQLNEETLSTMDQATREEIAELREFARRCLLPGLIGRHLV